MPNVKISDEAYAMIAEAAGAASLSVQEWVERAIREKAPRGTIGAAPDLQQLWQQTVTELAPEVASRQQSYLRRIRLRGIVENTALLEAPDAFTRDVVESRLRPTVALALGRQLGRPVDVAVTIRPDPAGPQFATQAVTPASPTASARPAPSTAGDLTGRYAELIARPDIARQLAAILAAADS
jgi:hypothetical protein